MMKITNQQLYKTRLYNYSGNVRIICWAQMQLRKYIVFRNGGEQINRIVTVENKLRSVAAGKIPPPTPEQAREWANILSLPRG